MNKRKTQTLSESLNGLFRQLGIESEIKQQQLIQTWSEIVGEAIAGVSVAEKVIDQVLYVRVQNMTWRTELLFQKAHILENIEKLVGKGIIEDIRFF